MKPILLQHELPQHLIPRSEPESLVVLGLFVVCIFMVALARMRERSIFLYLFQGVFMFKSLEDLSKEDYKTQSPASLLFVIQFLFITAGSVYWLYFLNTPLTDWQRFIPVLVPAIYFLYQLFISNIATRFSGNPGLLQEFNYFTLLLTQLFGILFLVELFVAYFRPEPILTWVMIGTYVFYLLFRFIRGFWIVFKQGVPWYYIILYFWTLEILPLLVATRLLYHDEFQNWIG